MYRVSINEICKQPVGKTMQWNLMKMKERYTEIVGILSRKKMTTGFKTLPRWRIIINSEHIQWTAEKRKYSECKIFRPDKFFSILL